jgi:exopolysaccharide biosynthesis polyprenyl glycosylphosphotransferase
MDYTEGASQESSGQAWPHHGLQLSDRRLLLLGGDSLAVSLAVVLALWLGTLTSGEAFSDLGFHNRHAWLFGLVPVWIGLHTQLYDLHTASLINSTLRELLQNLVLALGLYLALYFLAPQGVLPRLVVLYFLAGAFFFTVVWRFIYIRVFAEPHFKIRTLVVGAGRAGEMITTTLTQLYPSQYLIAGIIDDHPDKIGRTLCDLPILGGHRYLLEAAKNHRVSEIILAITGEIQGGMFQALLDCQEYGLHITRMPMLYEQLTRQVPIHHLDADWIMTSFVDTVRPNNIYRGLRRMLDLIIATFGLTLLVFIFPWLALLIWIESGRPIIYRQIRAGRGGRAFTMLKFRTMVPGAEADAQPLWATPTDPRITRVGWFLRRTRLDEIPQFWNVFKGEMSLVGPRPERPGFIGMLEKQIPFYRARLLVKPGLTGWAQINYGYANSVEHAMTKLQYDLYYIKHQSLWLDLLILLQTIGVVVKFQGT